MKDNNTIATRHFEVQDYGLIMHGRVYYWHIPKALRYLNMQPGDIVKVPASRKGKYHGVYVVNSFREDIEVAGKVYKPVLDIYFRTPETRIIENEKKVYYNQEDLCKGY
ncbi:hypothetical protein SAMN04489762_3450 [Terribacillus saccharophilus]|uniref:Uncharacterized protein n=1 Tax=Terribacillus saccharophilus TaxID=361277 RepID=A0AAX2EJT2_9BACI|nr:hypothetical protein SAMN04489762_3450 [Terribacillus saccharophilus]